MVTGNASEVVELSKSRVAIQYATGTKVDELASQYKLSKSNMRQALRDMGIIRREAGDEKPIREGKVNPRVEKFHEVCTKFELNPEYVHELLDDLGLKYKDGSRKNVSTTKYKIIDDTTTVL